MGFTMAATRLRLSISRDQICVLEHAIHRYDIFIATPRLCCRTAWSHVVVIYASAVISVATRAEAWRDAWEAH